MERQEYLFEENKIKDEEGIEEEEFTAETQRKSTLQRFSKEVFIS